MIIKFEELPTNIEALEKEWQALHNFPPGLMLYHFTSPEGLVGIIKSGSIWATLATDLDDALELKHARPCSRENEPSPDAWQQPWWQALGANYRFDPILESVEAWRCIKGPFVISFCRCCPLEMRSSEYMWEEYAEKGKGFALGIRVGRCEGPTATAGALLRKVEYDKAQQEQRRKRIAQLNRHVEAFRKVLLKAIQIDAQRLPNGCTDPGIVARRLREMDGIEVLQARLHRMALELAACAKDVGFSSEQEMRLLVYQVEHPLKRESSEGKEISYIEVPVRNLTAESTRATQCPVRLELEEIVVGPAAADARKLEEVVDQIADRQVISGTGLPAVRIRHCQRTPTACSL